MIHIGKMRVLPPTEVEIDAGLRGSVESDIPCIYGDWMRLLELVGGELGVEYDLMLVKKGLSDE